MEGLNNISEIRKKINELDVQKEAAFKESKDKQKIIFDQIRNVKELRGTYHSSLSELRNIIKQRDNLNKQVRQAIAKKRQIDNSKKEFLKKNKTKFDPYRIKSEIDALETKIETQGVDFDQEKKLMKKINELKKIYNQSTELINLVKEQKTLQSGINKNRLKADELHRKIRDMQGKNKNLRKEFIIKSREIMNLKKQQGEAYHKFLALKGQFSQLNNIIKNSNLRYKKTKEQNKRQMLEQKHQQLEQKIKNKQKITTEDLILYQSR